MSLRGITLWCVWLCLSEVSRGAVKQYKFDVQYMYGAPDCVEQVVMGINGHFPGPTITAEEGDTLHIILTNNLLTEGTVLHWHGIRQYGTPWADGTASISQCAIAPGQTFHYRFTVDRAGTYFYHGHYGLQRTAGLYGSLIVNLAKGKKEAFHYDGEFNLLLSDWWHKTTLEQEVGLSSIPFRWVNEPQSLLINGRGQYNCSLAANVMKTSLSECNFRGNEECAPQIFDVHPNMTYRIRIASATSLASLNLAIGNHKLVVVEADGNYVKPFTVDDIDIYSGETYSVLLRTNQDPRKNYWISIGVRGRKPNTPQGLTILNYKTNSATLLPTSPPPITPQWDDYNRSKTFTYNIFGLKGTQKPPKYYHRRLLLLNTQNLVRGYTKWAINNVSLTLPSTPYLASINVNGSFDTKIPPNTFSEGYDIYNPPLNPNANTGSGVYMFQLNQVVDVILQNANVLKGQNSEIHPWHLHGHDFWVLGYGDGKFQQSDERKFNLKNPPLRNNVVVFPYGWTALRFRADNPGVWPFHCHIEPHLYMGMGVVFAEALLNVKRIPNQALACGHLRNVSINKKHN